ncbi:hypothetical protein ACVBEG_26775 [Pseudomonas sp. GG8]
MVQPIYDAVDVHQGQRPGRRPWQSSRDAANDQFEALRIHVDGLDEKVLE